MDLQTNSLFNGVTSKQVDEFVAACNEFEFSAGTEVITRGQHGKFMFFLVAGELSVRLPERPGKTELALLRPPAVFGEMEMLTGRPRTANVIATTKVKLLGIPIKTFRQRLNDGDSATLKIMENIGRVLAHRVEAMTEKILELETVVPEERCIELQQFREQLFSDWSS